MKLKKFRADRFFDGCRMHTSSPVLITRENGSILDIVEPAEAGDDILEMEGILAPGFINCHCHLELSHMRGIIPEATGLVEFVKSVMSSRHFGEEDVLQAIEDAEDEMIAAGIVVVGDICNNNQTISQKQKDRIWYHNFIEVTGLNPAIADQRFRKSLGFYREFLKIYPDAGAPVSITPHAAYSVAEELWEKIIAFPGNSLLSIHNQESAAEDQWFRSGEGEMKFLYEALQLDNSFFKPSGKSSLQTYLPRIHADQSVLLVHNVFTSREDLAFAARSEMDLHWCICANANWYISRTMPDLEMLIDEGCHIVLGTDSLASNNQLSILAELNSIRRHYPKISLETMLSWATSNGAKALKVEDRFGRLEKGLQPGVVLIHNELEKVTRLI